MTGWFRPTGWTALVVVCCSAASLPNARGQQAPSGLKPKPVADPVRDAIRSVEATAEGYRLKLRDERVFDAEANAALAMAIASLNTPVFEPALERHRERLRVLLYGDAVEAKVWDEAALAGIGLLDKMARNDEVHPATNRPVVSLPVRINAMLLAGEIRAKDPDGKPDRYPPAATAILAAAAADGELSAAVRVAALIGVTRHVEAAKKAGPATLSPLAASIGPTLVALATAGLEGGQAAEWMAARALTTLALFAPALPPGTNGAAARLAVDANRSLDLRVRAARLLGMATGPASDFNAPAVENVVGPLALAALRGDETLADDRRLHQRLTAPAALPGAPPKVVPPLGSLECQRTAWRLATLADSLLTADGKSGLVLASGGETKAGRELATKLRAEAEKIKANPVESQVRATLALLAPSAAIPVQEPRPDVPIAPTAPMEESPFAAPGTPGAAPR